MIKKTKSLSELDSNFCIVFFVKGILVNNIKIIGPEIYNMKELNASLGLEDVMNEAKLLQIYNKIKTLIFVICILLKYTTNENIRKRI